jgi:carbamoyl-phosphate synthase small subunit
MAPLSKKRFFSKGPFSSAKLVLQDGTVFSGQSIGSPQSIAGETVFCTGMVGYEQSLTDPSFSGQLLCFTYPMIGNYGVPRMKRKNGLQPFFESDRVQVSGVIVSETSQQPSHWNSIQSFSDWLKEEKIPGIAGIDTRKLTQHLRTKGSMLGKIVVNHQSVDWFDPNQTNLVESVSCTKPKQFGSFPTKVVLVDCGAKNNIVRSLLKRKISVLKVPWDFDFASEQNGLEFDGVVVSNGPGDPVQCTKTIYNIQNYLLQKKPFFGICLGNQLLALSIDAKTFKLKFGHRSQNQPCQLAGEKRAFITSQNHGFAVNPKTLPRHWKEWFVNANDGSNEGIVCDNRPFRSVQFHPEATPGPVDTNFLFDEFKRELRK